MCQIGSAHAGKIEKQLYCWYPVGGDRAFASISGNNLGYLGKNEMDESVRRTFRARIQEEPFARKIGLRIVDFQEGYARVEMDVSQDLTDMFGAFHAGAIFSLVDEAFQLAGNAHGTVAVALKMNISYYMPPALGSRLIAEAREYHRNGKTAYYEIHVKDEGGRLIASSHALAYRKAEPLPFLRPQDS